MTAPAWTMARRTIKAGCTAREYWTLALADLRVFFVSWEEARRYCKRWGIDPTMED